MTARDIKKPFSPGRMVGYKLKSLRRYDPDQVLRVEALGLLSARYTGSPFYCEASIRRLRPPVKTKIR